MKNDNKITRKDAIKRMGKYAALTAAGTFFILNPAHSQRNSPGSNGNGGGNGVGGGNGGGNPNGRDILE